ncbi:Methylphosphotriester-DNA--protein-cysteine S-methyltransferase [Phaeobacter sp. CECT 5382]|uniref:AraC family transcriptional regulator n=1 Tax=Phaeobacter sp. CECT 5382 TaxID=1712645 RepID=UPI0006DA2546|nr:AraC family transcriptional regulator [Phaeobacter sp. CECT 5382]CUH88190.1 Methylphosphotriester-DNA--protein-cysteine S-methyltransferase [Phaeobacter sp. CECT 5382]
MSIAYEDRILRVLDYIHDNPDGDLSLDQLADVAAMSRFHWHRVFRAITGETCAQAVRRIRLHRAASALVMTQTPVDRIAQAVGYPNAGSFSRAFTEGYGASPTAFRKAGRHLPSRPDFRTGDYPMYPVTLRQDPALRLVGLSHAGSYHSIGKKFEAFGALCQTRNLWSQMAGMAAIYYDNPDDTPEGDLRSFAGGLFHGAAVPNGMEERQIAGGKTAVLTYKGPYSGISAAYHSLFGNWLPDSGEDPADAPCYEIYLNNPREVPAEELITEICLPLR